MTPSACPVCGQPLIVTPSGLFWSCPAMHGKLIPIGRPNLKDVAEAAKNWKRKLNEAFPKEG